MTQRNKIERPTLFGRLPATWLAAIAVTAGSLSGAGCSEADTSVADVAQASSTALAGQVSDAALTEAKVTGENITTATAAPSGGDFASAWGPAVGSNIPMLAAADHLGQSQTLESLTGDKGLLLVFSRSADW